MSYLPYVDNQSRPRVDLRQSVYIRRHEMMNIHFENIAHPIRYNFQFPTPFHLSPYISSELVSKIYQILKLYSNPTDNEWAHISRRPQQPNTTFCPQA